MHIKRPVYQDACQLSWKNFRLPKPEDRYPYLPNARSTTRDRGNDLRRWAFYRHGGFRVVDGETLDGWGVISRSLHGTIDVMLGPAVTTEAQIAFSGARAHANITDEMTALIDAWDVLEVLMVQWLGISSRVSFMIPEEAAGVCLGTIQAREQMQLALASQQVYVLRQHRLRLTSAENVYGHEGNLGQCNVLTMPLHLGHSDLLLATEAATFWIRNNFDASICFDWLKQHQPGLATIAAHQNGFSVAT